MLGMKLVTDPRMPKDTALLIDTARYKIRFDDDGTVKLVVEHKQGDPPPPAPVMLRF